MIKKIKFKNDSFRIKTEHDCSRTGEVYFRKAELVPSAAMEVCLMTFAKGGLTDRQVELCEHVLSEELAVLCEGNRSDYLLDEIYCHYPRELMEGLVAAYAA